ncbi:MAG: hypothetical protein JW798_11285 [Prolixibacteraceae bacterium]|nr:hypothetical protein [Prolixibacteraceae bacterium]
MPSTQQKPEYGHFYHIYNRGINGCALFHCSDNYEHFLRLYEKYITPVANTYAWVLMGNHFHFLVRIMGKDEIGVYKQLNSDRTDDSVRFQTTQNLSEFEVPDKVKIPNVSRHFSHLFNAYTKYFNKVFKRTGSLFERPFKRIKVTSEAQLKYLIYYIHHNPVHHGFCDEMVEYPWSSYLSIFSPKRTRLKRAEVLKWYENIDNFRKYHDKQTVNRFAELQVDLPVYQMSKNKNMTECNRTPEGLADTSSPGKILSESERPERV